jgi:hypothetical protein
VSAAKSLQSIRAPFRRPNLICSKGNSLFQIAYQHSEHRNFAPVIRRG